MVRRSLSAVFIPIPFTVREQWAGLAHQPPGSLGAIAETGLVGSTQHDVHMQTRCFLNPYGLVSPWLTDSLAFPFLLKRIRLVAVANGMVQSPPSSTGQYPGVSAGCYVKGGEVTVICGPSAPGTGLSWANARRGQSSGHILPPLFMLSGSSLGLTPLGLIRVNKCISI